MGNPSIEFKLIILVVVLLMALLLGLLPVKLQLSPKGKKFLGHGASFASGVFLAAGMIHLLPDSVGLFHKTWPGLEYPVPFALAVFTIYLLRLLQMGGSGYWAHPKSPSPYLVAIVMSVHSVITGMAMGAGSEFAAVLVIALAILAHKGSAAFALGVLFRQSNISEKNSTWAIVLFSMMTPIGILIGILAETVVTHHVAMVFQSVFSAIAAGTFITIATFDGPLASSHLEQCHKQVAHLLYALLGIGLMALIAVWL